MHVDMIEIRLEIMYHQLNIDLEAKLVHEKRKTLDTDRYKVF